MQMMDMRYENHVIEIKDFSDAALDVYARLNEVQLLNRQDLSQGMFIAESPKVIERALDGGYEPVSFLCWNGKRCRWRLGVPACRCIRPERISFGISPAFP